MESISEESGHGTGTRRNSPLLRIELGGGKIPKPGYVNVDMCDGADCKHDLEKPLPFADDSVEAVYSSHCMEHVDRVFLLLNEICRVCVIGARVTIAVPHFGQEMAMCPGHRHVISEMMIDHFTELPENCWTGDKMLALLGKSYRPTKHFDEAKRLFPHLSDEQIYRFIQNTCHDVTFDLEVRAYVPGD